MTRERYFTESDGNIPFDIQKTCVTIRLMKTVAKRTSALDINSSRVQNHTTQHNTTQHNTTQHNTTQHNTSRNSVRFDIASLLCFKSVTTLLFVKQDLVGNFNFPVRSFCFLD